MIKGRGREIKRTQSESRVESRKSNELTTHIADRAACFATARYTDAAVVQKLAGDRDVALQTMNIPYPYKDGLAEQWLSTLADQFVEGKQAAFAIVARANDKPEGEFIGAIGLMIEPDHERAELGYWVGKPYWGNGYCTEAVRAILAYGFEQLGLRRIQAWHFFRNVPSGRVMRKIGMTHEGHLRQHIKRGNEVHDVEVYGILRSEYR